MPVFVAAGSPAFRVLFWFSLAAVSAVSLLPDFGEEMVFPLQDKVLHAGAYFYFYVLGWFGFARAEKNPWQMRLFFGLFVYGIAVELLQDLTGYRARDIADLFANLTGLCLGLGAVALYSRWKG